MGKQLVPAELYLLEEKSQRQQGKEYSNFMITNRTDYKPHFQSVSNFSFFLHK